MATINFLPWRERRQQLKQNFLVVLAVVAVAGVILMAIIDIAVNKAINNQKAKNNYLEEQLAELELQVKAVGELEQKKQALSERIKVIQALQGNRPIIVRVFDQLVRRLRGCFLPSIVP